MKNEIDAGDAVRMVIQTAYCMEYDEYCKVFRLVDNYYAKEKWEKQQKDFGKWFCDLDKGNAELFAEYALDKQNK